MKNCRYDVLRTRFDHRAPLIKAVLHLMDFNMEFYQQIPSVCTEVLGHSLRYGFIDPPREEVLLIFIVFLHSEGKSLLLWKEAS